MQSPQKLSTEGKGWVLTAAMAYTVLSFMFAGFVLTNVFDCIDVDNIRETERCIADVESRGAVFQAFFSLSQLGGIITALVILIKHSDARKQLLYQQQLAQMQQPESPQEESKDDDPEQK